MATNYAITSSNGGTWTIQSTNSASIGRYHDLSLLMEGNSDAAQLITSRPGVLPASPNTGATLPMALLVISANSGLTASVYLGAAVVERSSNVGCYLVQSRGTGSVTLSAADSTNPRIDRIDLQVLDGALGDNGGTSLTQIVVTTGVAAGSPVAPAAPTNSIPLATVLLPANTTTLTTGMITDKRKSAALRGGVRVLLPGDALADRGWMVGELRDTVTLQTPGTIDRWNPVTSVWETLAICGAGANLAKYTAAVTATGQNQVLNGNAATTIQFVNARKTTPLVTASGTNNTTFTLNKAGGWRFTWGARVFGGVGNAPDVFVQIIRGDTGEILSAEYVGQVPPNKTWDFSGAGGDYFAASGISVSMSITTQNTPNSTTIGSGTASTGLRTYLTMEWEGP